MVSFGEKLHTFAMSRYNESGNETLRMKRTITARRSVNNQRKGVVGREGKSAARTCGMVSPTIMQNAIIPPNALIVVSCAMLRVQ